MKTTQKTRRTFPVSYSVNVEYDDTVSPEGSFASGDDAQDTALVAEIRSRLANDDVWAWFAATVTARDDEGNEGWDSLGGCCYRDRDDFETNLLPEMKANALAHLKEVRRAKRASKRPGAVKGARAGGEF